MNKRDWRRLIGKGDGYKVHRASTTYGSMVTDSYWMLREDFTKGLELPGDQNGMFTAAKMTDEWVRVSDAPNCQRLIDSAIEREGYQELTPAEYEGRQVFTGYPDMVQTTWLEATDLRICLDADYWQLFQTVTGNMAYNVTYWGVDSMRPVIVKLGEEVIGLVMPIRYK